MKLRFDVFESKVILPAKQTFCIEHKKIPGSKRVVCQGFKKEDYVFLYLFLIINEIMEIVTKKTYVVIA